MIKGLCPPDVVVVSPPSCAPSLHPSKRCRLTPTTATAPDSNDSSTNTLASNSSCSYKRRPPPFLPSMAAGSAAYAGSTGTSQTLQAPAPQPPALQLNPPPGSVSLPNSPCSESSTMQRTLLVKHVSTVTSSGLASKLTAQPPLPKGGPPTSGDGSGYLLVDCRPFIAYNVSHIKGAINVNCCNRLNRKRLQMGKATLADLATTKEGKEVVFGLPFKIEKTHCHSLIFWSSMFLTFRSY